MNWFKNVLIVIGLKGEPGKDGTPGSMGMKGDKGDPGIDGKDGVNGKDGLNGRDGFDGKDGPQGAKGESGLDGLNGKDGRDGKDGEQGVKGDRGEIGLSGKDGIDGVQGQKGDTGEKGEQGIPGKDGLNGKDGKDGKDGIQGPKGEKGDIGIKSLYFNNGNSIIDLKPNPSFNKIIFSHNGQGLIAVAEPTGNGKIVINSDEWILSNTGFKNSQETSTFILNLIKYFVGEKKGCKFHAISTNFGLTESSLEASIVGAGHTWTKGITIDLSTLSKYDAIFVAGDVVDNRVLIQYVKNGGNVYLAAGTGWGGAESEANRWNTFLGEFDLKFSGVYNGISGNISPSQSHPLFVGMVPNLDGLQKAIDDLNSRLKTLEASHKDLSDKHARLTSNLGIHSKQFKKWDEVA